MSTVFASDVDDWDDGNECGNPFREVPLHSCQLLNQNKEGYTGTPTSYRDIDGDAEMVNAQKKYSDYCQKNYERNIETVKDCMESGIVMPSVIAARKMMTELESIAKGNRNG